MSNDTWTHRVVLQTELIQLLSRREQGRPRSVCIYYPLSLRRGAELKAKDQDWVHICLPNSEMSAIWKNDTFFDMMSEMRELR